MPTRRRFLATSAAIGVASLAEVPWLGKLAPVGAAEADLNPQAVRLDPSIEPLVSLIETTPRESLVEEIAQRVRRGSLSYRDVLTGLFLAGVRNIQPRPAVGFKFHAVLVVNSAHLASLASADEDRWLPIFWALDQFKSSQARDVQEGNWTMGPVREDRLPAASGAEEAFVRAMESWDEEAADVATAAIVRHLPAQRVFQLFARFASRDFRSIGHKAIYLANSWRTLQCIGWHHAEPVLRSLTYALLNHEGEPNPAQNQLAPDQPWRENQPLADQWRGDWFEARSSSDGVTSEWIDALRTVSPNESCQRVTQMLNDGRPLQSIWDGLFVASSELLMRQPGIVALHAVTSTNALAYIFQQVGDDRLRRLTLLQNAAFVPLFREAMKGRGAVGDESVEKLQTAAREVSDSQGNVERVFDLVHSQPWQAAQLALATLRGGTTAEDLMRVARQLVFLKGDDSHDYKFSSAVLEDYYHVSPTWRNEFLSAATYHLRGRGEPTNPLVDRIRTALA